MVFYLWDDEWGPALVKLCPFAPYPLWINANGHEWLKRQLAKHGIGFEELDNGLRSVTDPSEAIRLASRLAAGHLRSALSRWLSWLPNPLIAADRRVGMSYGFSVRQIELSETAVFDRPANGRAWFESAIRNHLDLGRPSEVSLVVDRRICNRARRPTPGRFETRVVTADVDPEIRVRYKSDKVKAYFKERRTLRVETTINNPATSRSGDGYAPRTGGRCAGPGSRSTLASCPRSPTPNTSRPIPPPSRRWPCRRLAPTASEHQDCALETRGCWRYSPPCRTCPTSLAG